MAKNGARRGGTGSRAQPHQPRGPRSPVRGHPGGDRSRTGCPGGRRRPAGARARAGSATASHPAARRAGGAAEGAQPADGGAQLRDGAHRRRRLGRRGHRPGAPTRRPRPGAARPRRARCRRRDEHAGRRGSPPRASAIEHDRDVVAGRAGAADAAIFDAHLALLDDEALLEPARAAIAAGATAERAWYDAAQQVAAIYRGLDEPLLQERATDVLDVGRRVVNAIAGVGPGRRRIGIGDRRRRRADPGRCRRPGSRAGAGHRHRARVDHRPRRHPGAGARAARGRRPGRRRCSQSPTGRCCCSTARRAR